MDPTSPAERDRFMRRALELAGTPHSTGGNPRVGAVLVRDGRVIAEGFHRGRGEAHAETVALEGIDARGATLYVNLEPCSHHGSTPPCAPAVAEAGVAQVVVAIEDPDERVTGRGIAYLREQGIEVITGVLAAEATALNAAYLRHRTTGRPLVTLKLALTLDGRLTAPDHTNRWITGAAARTEVHRRRAEVDAVIVGAGTVLTDDPSLTVRAIATDHQPVRVVLDSTGRVPATAKLFGEQGLTVVATTEAAPDAAIAAWTDVGAEVLVLPRGEAGVDLTAFLEALGGRGWVHVLCEGGAAVATSLLAAELVDRLELHYGTIVAGDGGLSLGDVGVKTLSDARRWRLVDARPVGEDAVVVLERSD